MDLLAKRCESKRLCREAVLICKNRCLKSQSTNLGMFMEDGAFISACKNSLSLKCRQAVIQTAPARRLLIMILMRPLQNRKLMFVFCCAILFGLTLSVATFSFDRLADAYNAHQAKGLFLRKRAKHHRCPRCRGFGIERCDLCKSTGFRVYELKFVFTDPCPKCICKRWQWCSRCGGSGDVSKPWGDWAIPKLIYLLFPG